MKQKISNDMEYWQLREDLQNLQARIEDVVKQNEDDKVTLKSLQKEAAALGKTMSSYEKKKNSDKKKQNRKEQSVKKTQSVKKKKKNEDDAIIFSISPMEAEYFDFTALDETQRSHLIFKKKQFLDMVKEGQFVQLYDDDTLYRVRKGTGDKEGKLYIVSVRYGEAMVQDIALIVHRLIQAAEVEKTGQILN